MYSFHKIIILFFIILIVIFTGCVRERGHSPVFDPINNDNNGGNDDHGINIKYANELPELEQAIFDLTNQHRLNLGLDELAWSNTIAKQCRQHSSNMALGNLSFGHQGLDERLNKIRRNFPNAMGTELIAKHSSSYNLAKKIFQNWLESAEYRQNIEGNFQTTGVGVAKNANEFFYFTQIFIRQGELN
jgi:uncharacterized protein YkwD